MASRRTKRATPITRELFVKRIALDVAASSVLPEEYPFDLAAIRHLGERDLTSRVTVFVGENGIGKSTLLEALAVAVRLNPEGGSRNLKFATKNTHSELHGLLRITRGPRAPRDAYFLRAESFYNVASAVDALDADPDANYVSGEFDLPPVPLVEALGGRSLHEQSHGESFFSLFMNRLGSHGLYLLDEPEAALSPQRQLALLVRMHQLVESGSQCILATHSPLLMAYPGADVWLFGPDGITPTVAAATEHWQITKRFLNDPGGMLRELLSRATSPFRGAGGFRGRLLTRILLSRRSHGEHGLVSVLTTPNRLGGPTPCALANSARSDGNAATHARHATNARPGNAAAPRLLTARRTGPLVRAGMAPRVGLEPTTR